MSEDKYILPVLTIVEVIPTLSHENNIYASKLIAKIGNLEIQLYETKGLDYNQFIGEEVECLLEITKGDIIYEEEDKKNKKEVISFKYKWDRTPLIFFPKLMEMVSGEERTGFYSKEEEDEFEELAFNTINNWGLDGLGLEYNKRKPMLHSERGIFLLNEYEFEEAIDYWDLEEEIHIKIKEAYLRGIRPYVPQEEEAEKPQLTEAQKAELERRRAQQELSRIAYEEMQERIKQRRASGEGPSLLV